MMNPQPPLEEDLLVRGCPGRTGAAVLAGQPCGDPPSCTFGLCTRFIYVSARIMTHSPPAPSGGAPQGPAVVRRGSGLSGEDRGGDRYMRIYNLESPRGDPLMQAPRRSSGSLSDALPLTPQNIDSTFVEQVVVPFAPGLPPREPGSPGGSSARSMGSDRSFRRPVAGVRLSVIQDNEIDPSKVLTFEEAKAEEGARYAPILFSDSFVSASLVSRSGEVRVCGWSSMINRHVQRLIM